MNADGHVMRLPRVAGRAALLDVLIRNAFPVALVALITVALAVLSPGLFVADSWMTLVSGREIVQHGLPHHNTLTVWAHGAKWVDQQWLAQLVWYGIARIAGLGGVAIAGALVGGLTYASAMTASRLLGATARSTFLVAFLGLFVAPWTWQVRAQSFALPLFVWTLYLAARHARHPSRRLLAVFPLLILWANVHGTVILGAITVSLAIVVASVRHPGRQPRALAFPLLVATWACVLATPYIADIVSYYRLMLINPPFGKLISEWQRTTPSWLTASFFVVAALTLVVAIVQRRRVVLFDALVLVVTLVGAIQALRGITWFALAVLVLLPRMLDGILRKPDVVQMPLANAMLSCTAIVATAVVVAVVAAKPAAWFEHRWPTEAISAVRAAGPGTRVLASDRHADWLLWRIPSLRGRLAYDVRFELYRHPQIVALARFDFQKGRDWWSVADGYGVVVVDETSDSPPTRGLLRRGRHMLYHNTDISVLAR